MEYSVVYVTPKRKFDCDTTCSPSDASLVEKRAKESNSPIVTSPGVEDEVMATLNLSDFKVSLHGNSCKGSKAPLYPMSKSTLLAMKQHVVKTVPSQVYKMVSDQAGGSI